MPNRNILTYLLICVTLSVKENCRTRAAAGTVSSAGPVQADEADSAAGCGNEAECDEVCS